MAEEKTSTDLAQPANPNAKPGEPGHLSEAVAKAISGIKPQGAAKPADTLKP